MENKTRVKGLLERKLEDPEYRKRFEEEYDAFTLEVQILLAMEKKDWSYSDLAKAVGTSKSNISRDLKGGGLVKASFARIRRMIEALGMRFVTLVVPKEYAEELTQRFHEMIQQINENSNVTSHIASTTNLPVMYPSPLGPWISTNTANEHSEWIGAHQ